MFLPKKLRFCSSRVSWTDSGMLSGRLPILYNSPGINFSSLHDAFIDNLTFAMILFAVLKSQPSPCRLSCSSKTGDNAWASDATLCRAGSPQWGEASTYVSRVIISREIVFMKNLWIPVYIGRVNRVIFAFQCNLARVHPSSNLKPNDMYVASMIKDQCEKEGHSKMIINPQLHCQDLTNMLNILILVPFVEASWNYI